jgi:hypothetical protein
LPQKLGFKRFLIGPRLPYVITLVVVIFLCALHALWCRTPVFPVDDAYITIHNAQVFAGAPEQSFLGTPALAGSTSVVHGLIVSAFAIVLSPLWAALLVRSEIPFISY